MFNLHEAAKWHVLEITHLDKGNVLQVERGSCWSGTNNTKKDDVFSLIYLSSNAFTPLPLVYHCNLNSHWITESEFVPSVFLFFPFFVFSIYYYELPDGIYWVMSQRHTDPIFLDFFPLRWYLLRMFWWILFFNGMDIFLCIGYYLLYSNLLFGVVFYVFSFNRMNCVKISIQKALYYVLFGLVENVSLV